ncbi:hypothetical protein CMQ_3244 [Grosmannia clavigera kw1407]|uniref:Uncharacterized protein n=1 Tax=Grosmannia clavigera (strain kw1407 / UAMH 11150) TaxID=655863 RepID=F0XI73_GROCL|nr:uncharacterized protein CMQ_3244 [Grosmannia clavigera kw1407]EFX03315.1 hypothetical protein CMQ_3244 [Grosmannia clavigera kw1407]
MSAPPPASMAAQAEGVKGQPKIYRLVMTPIIFISFLFSLAWVEFRYTLLRSHTHVGIDGRPTRRPPARQQRLPPWLHRIVYRQQEYQYEVQEPTGGGATANDNFHYHSMQRKLLKMEAAEAFHIRTTVLGTAGMVDSRVAVALRDRLNRRASREITRADTNTYIGRDSHQASPQQRGQTDGSPGEDQDPLINKQSLADSGMLASIRQEVRSTLEIEIEYDAHHVQRFLSRSWQIVRCTMATDTKSPRLRPGRAGLTSALGLRW